MKNRNFPLLNAEFNNLNLQIVENALYHGDKSWIFNDVVSSFSRMYFVISGSAYIENEDQRHDLQPGKIYLIPAGSRYNYRCPFQVQKFYLHFQLELLPGVDVFQGLNECLAMDFSPELLEQILRYAREGSLSGLLRLKAIFTDIASQFLEQAMEELDYRKNYSGFYKQQEVLKYISEHLDSRLRIMDIAEALDIPYHQLTRNFKQDTGLGLKEYMEKQLLHKAKHRLLTTELSISEIAEELQFCDAFYFSRFFRKYELEAPSEYRRRRK